MKKLLCDNLIQNQIKKNYSNNYLHYCIPNINLELNLNMPGSREVSIE